MEVHSMGGGGPARKDQSPKKKKSKKKNPEEKVVWVEVPSSPTASCARAMY